MSSADHSEPHTIPVKYPCPVRRVTIQWDGNDWRITKEVRVPSMTLPAADPLPAGEQSRGFWVEATDSEGGVYHREVMSDPLAGMEQFHDDGQITRLAHPLHELTLEVLLPDLPEVSELHLVSNSYAAPAEPDKHARPRRTVLDLSREPPNPTGGGEAPDGEGRGPHERGGHGGHHH